MALTKQEMLDIVSTYGKTAQDTGSSEVQIAALSHKIGVLTEHMKKNHKDFVTRRAILKMVADRRKLLNYLKRTDEARYNDIKQKLGLK